MEPKMLTMCQMMQWSNSTVNQEDKLTYLNSHTRVRQIASRQEERIAPLVKKSHTGCTDQMRPEQMIIQISTWNTCFEDVFAHTNRKQKPPQRNTESDTVDGTAQIMAILSGMQNQTINPFKKESKT
jgi:hypothetical protein